MELFANGEDCRKGNAMGRLFGLVAVFTSGLLFGLILRSGSPPALAGEGGAETCTGKNGDLTGDGKVDLSDAVTLLGSLFLGKPPQLLPLCESPGARGLPDTGQKRCYNVQGVEFDCSGLLQAKCPFQGQDAQWPTGCPNDANRFTINTDETVTDNCTGLQWMRFTVDRDGDGTADVLQWCDALDYCDKLTFAGHTDWRLPNVRELQSIVDYGRTDPSIDPAFVAESGNYWSSTSSTLNHDAAWGVVFFDSKINFFAKGGSNAYVRAVRNAQ
jgi:hypothetical protein